MRPIIFCKARDKHIPGHRVEDCNKCKALRRKLYRQEGRDKNYNGGRGYQWRNKE